MGTASGTVNIRNMSGGLVILGLCVLLAPIVGSCKDKESDASGERTGAQKAQAHATAQKVVVDSSIAGTWYSADANELKRQIGEFFSKADTPPAKDVTALILPHAGYIYSGQTAVHAVKAAAGDYQRIIVIGPTHHLPMAEMLALPAGTHYRTPLGEVPLDVDFIDRLLKYPLFQVVPAAHQPEHSVQIEIPLLQFNRQPFRLVPIVAGQCSYDTIVRAANILKELVDDKTLIVASSDFVHYGPQYQYVPFRDDVAANIKKLDMGAFEYIQRLDARGFLNYTETTGATICGRVPIAILLSTLDPAAKAQLIKYTTSGQLTSDFTNSVSYLAVAFSGGFAHDAKTEPQTSSTALSEQDKSQLLNLARKTISYVLQNKSLPAVATFGIQPSEAMKVPRAAFVTLKEHAQLRGCIGEIFPRQPLYNAVLVNAANAAFRDPRFSPITESEYSQIEIEISALTAPRPISSPNEIRLGTDGVVMNKDGHSAVFLPQVATEQGWGLEEMLKNLSLKAGLAPDAWRDGATFLVFQAEVFGEKK
jgi:AmmeMemoRadiSam system protein B/AmmeMemoRadiSam system protein A